MLYKFTLHLFFFVKYIVILLANLQQVVQKKKRLELIEYK